MVHAEQHLEHKDQISFPYVLAKVDLFTHYHRGQSPKTSTSNGAGEHERREQISHKTVNLGFRRRRLEHKHGINHIATHIRHHVEEHVVALILIFDQGIFLAIAA